MQAGASVFRFGTADNRSAFPGRTHYHDTWELYYLTSGNCRYFIQNTTYNLATGDVVVMDVHSVLSFVIFSFIISAGHCSVKTFISFGISPLRACESTHLIV